MVRPLVHEGQEVYFFAGHGFRSSRQYRAGPACSNLGQTCNSHRAFSGYNGGVDFLLRDFRLDDFDILWQIDQKCFSPEIAYSRRELTIYVRSARSFTLVAETTSVKQAAKSTGGFDAAIVGFLVAEAYRGTGHIITIDVLPGERREGVGSQLLAAAEARLRAGQCRAVVLETAVDNQSALAFYKRHNYFLVKTVPGYYSNGVDALVLRKDLLSAAQAS